MSEASRPRQDSWGPAQGAAAVQTAPGRARLWLRSYWLHAGLFLATLLTTTAQGAADVHGGSYWPLGDGLSYSLPLMLILVCHELGHYFAARAHGVPATLPYFIPMPPPIGLLGTMGAVIVQSPTMDRKKLIDIGAAGPLAGLVVAIPVLLFGLAMSQVKPLSQLGLQEGNSLLYAGLKWLVKGEWLPGGGRDVVLHPTAWAGWAGLLVTMLNLLPIGQLDGGHVATAYFGNRYGRVAGILHAALPVLALTVLGVVYASARRDLAALGTAPGGITPGFIATQAAGMWLVWFGLLFLMKRMSDGRYHPPVGETPLPRSRVALFWVVCVSFVLTFMPVPLRISIGAADGSPSKTPATAPRHER
jgi:membrane-associated protease RseP (regulator of RpoE activity)